MQETLFEEISGTVSRRGGSFSNLDYNDVMEMSYLDKFLTETTRLYGLSLLERKCVKDYRIPGSDFVVPKGMLVQVFRHTYRQYPCGSKQKCAPVSLLNPQIPGSAMMRDPEIYPDPETFDPENFSPEKKSTRSPYSYLSFGQGPRNCIGMRLALLFAKLAIIKMVYEFR